VSRRILVTGGAGFIGSHLCEALLDRGDEVTVVDDLNEEFDGARKAASVERLSGRPGFTFHRLDVRDGPALRSLLREAGFAGIVHLAARPGVRESVRDPERTVDVNVRGTCTVLSEWGRASGGPFIFASSSSVYGERRDPPFAEDDRTEAPASPYAASKLAGELLVRTFARIHGFPAACLRYFTVYGPGQRPGMAISRFVSLVEAGHPLTLFGDGSSRRDYTYVSDAVRGTVLALDRAEGLRILNLGGGCPVSLRDLVRSIGEVVGRVPDVVHGAPEAGDVELTWAATERAEREIGWRALVPLTEGLRRYVAWVRSRPS
jgi:UDP-glucuronate 4-epimerase